MGRVAPHLKRKLSRQTIVNLLPPALAVRIRNEQFQQRTPVVIGRTLVVEAEYI